MILRTLGTEVTSELTARKVDIVYLDREAANRWNYERDSGELRVFCGWYWIRGRQEGGPFRSPSAAVRDAYYRLVLNREPTHALAVGKPRVIVDNARRRA